jgi:hypothetical protein
VPVHQLLQQSDGVVPSTGVATLSAVDLAVSRLHKLVSLLLFKKGNYKINGGF